MLMTLVTKVVNVSRFLYGAALAGVSAAAAAMERGARREDPGWGCEGSRDEPPPQPTQPSRLGPSGRSPQPELPVPRRLCRGGLSALQRIRQRRSLRCSCPPLFSPRAPGDAPVLPCLPESAAGPARAGRCPGHRVTPGLCPCPGARCCCRGLAAP